MQNKLAIAMTKRFGIELIRWSSNIKKNPITNVIFFAFTDKDQDQNEIVVS